MSSLPIRSLWTLYLASKQQILSSTDAIESIEEILNESSSVISFESAYESTQQIAHKQFAVQTKLHIPETNWWKIGAFDCKILRHIAKVFQILFPSKYSLWGGLALVLFIWLLSYLFDDKSIIIIGFVTILTLIIIGIFYSYDKQYSSINQDPHENICFIENGSFVECSQISVSPGDIILVGCKAYIFKKLTLSGTKQKTLKTHNKENLKVIIFKNAKNCFSLENHENFAEDLIKAEMDFELLLNLETFSQLIQLYTYAVKFYENIKESKRKFFKHRLQSLLSKINLIKLSQSQFQYLENDSQKHHRAHKQRKLKQINHPFDDTCVDYGHSDQNAIVIHEIKAEEAIERHHKNNKSICSRVQENVKIQSEDLHVRIGKRKKNLLNQTFSINMSNISDRSDRSDLEDFEVKFELYQIELEKMMDQFVDKNISKTLEIKTKYKEVLKNLDSIENILIQTKRRVETERAMQLEIDEVNKKIDEEKKQTILMLRQKFKLI